MFYLVKDSFGLMLEMAGMWADALQARSSYFFATLPCTFANCEHITMFCLCAQLHSFASNIH
jgi:hypothetical protein